MTRKMRAVVGQWPATVGYIAVVVTLILALSLARALGWL